MWREDGLSRRANGAPAAGVGVPECERYDSLPGGPTAHLRQGSDIKVGGVRRQAIHAIGVWVCVCVCGGCLSGHALAKSTSSAEGEPPDLGVEVLGRLACFCGALECASAQPTGQELAVRLSCEAYEAFIAALWRHRERKVRDCDSWLSFIMISNFKFISPSSSAIVSFLDYRV